MTIFLPVCIEKDYLKPFKKHKALMYKANLRLEQFCFTVIDTINEKMEKVKNKQPLDMRGLKLLTG